LADALDGRVKGRVADLGAGWGWLAHQALARCPRIAALDLFEAEARALDAARARTSPTPRAAFHWADVRTLPKADPPYDAVVANPPFHQGRAAEPDLGAAFIAAAARLLKPSGRLLMVANRQLPYEAPLDVAFARWEKLSEDRAFKVFAAERPPASLTLAPPPPAVTSCATGGPRMSDPPDARAALRANLRLVASLGATMTYHEAAGSVGLAPPHVIHSVTQLLEALMEEDAEAGHPFIAALVVSRAGDGLPATRLLRDGARGSGASRATPFTETAAAYHAAERALATAFHAEGP
jgi:predicted RNA methylase